MLPFAGFQPFGRLLKVKNYQGIVRQGDGLYRGLYNPGFVRAHTLIRRVNNAPLSATKMADAKDAQKQPLRIKRDIAS